MTKLVINRCYGGFGLSEHAKEWLEERGNFDSEYNIYRGNPLLLEYIDQFGGEAASGLYAKLKVVEIPDDVEWVIEEHAGYEHIAEVHRTWP